MRYVVLLALLSLLPAIAAGPDVGAAASAGGDSRDLVVVPVRVPPSPGPSGEVVQAPAALDLTTGVLRVSGRGWAKKGTPEGSQQRLQARKAARNQALRNLAFALQGAPVSSDETFEAFLRRQGGKASIDALVRVDRMALERDLPDGSAEVIVETDLFRHPELGKAVFAAPDRRRPGKRQWQRRPESAGALASLTAPEARGPFTGLVIVAAGIPAAPVLRPALVDESGKVVYGPGSASVDPETSAGGLAAYARGVEGARHLARVGGNPLVVAAEAVDGHGDLLLSRATADRVRAADRKPRFLRRAAVAIVVDAQP